MVVIRNTKVIYEFGDFVLDPKERLLRYGDQPIHLRAKEFETLVLFLENNGRAISKEEMMSVLWQGAFVEEGNLVKQISRLRKVLNSSGAELIQTIPKHGYRFSADVNRVFDHAGDPKLEEGTFRPRLTLQFENEIEDGPAPELRPRRKKLSRILVFGVFGLIALSTAGAAWVWQSQKQIVQTDEGSIVFLTDGSHHDSGATWIGEDQIYFSRRVSPTRTETWRMNAAGGDQHRANTEIKDLHQGRWSPDGKRVVFTKDNDKNYYLADASGANEIVLPFAVGNMDWSPDGSQFVYQAVKNSLGNHEIFLYTLATGENVVLAESDFGNADPSFSYDGKQIAFASWRDGNAEIYVMNADGSNVRRITDHPAFDQFPIFTPDGTAIAFQSNRENERTEIFLQNLEGDLPPVKIASTNGNTAICIKGWSSDGTQILLWSDQSGKGQILRSNVEPYPARLVLGDEKADLNFPRYSQDGKLLLFQAQIAGDRSIEIRLTDLEENKTRTIFKTASDYPPNHSLSPGWSPGGRQIVFADKSDGNSEVFIINSDGTGLQNLTNDPLPDTASVFSPDGREIFFTRNFYGEARLYRMHPDGSNQRPVTEKEGYEMGGAFSHDGSMLAFSGDRKKPDSQGLDIYLLDTSNPANERRLTSRPFHESFPTFSPDGKRIAFVSIADGNAELYIMTTAGTGLFRLTRSKWDEYAPQFTPDGKSLIFAADRNGKFAIYELELP